MLGNLKVFYWLMRSVIAKLGVRQHGFDLRSKIEIVVTFDGNEFGVLKHRRLKTNLKILSIGAVSSKCIILQ